MGCGGVGGGDDEQTTQDVGQGAPVFLGQRRDDGMLVVEKGSEGSVDDVPAGRREPDEDAAPVPRVGAALGEAPGDEPVDSGRHGPARDERLGDEPPRGELVGLARAPECGQDVELPGVEVVLGERRRADPRVLLGQPGDPGQDVQGSDIEVGSLALPGRDEPVDVVTGRCLGTGVHTDTVSSVKYLDIKIEGGVRSWAR